MDQASLSFMGIPMLALIPALPLLGALINLTLGRRLSKTTVSVIAIGSVTCARGRALYLVFWPLWHQFKAGEGEAGITQVEWHWLEVGSFKADLELHLDTLSA